MDKIVDPKNSIVTPAEVRVLRALKHNYFGNYEGDWVWADCINESKSPSKMDGAALAGVCSSLCKKELAESNGQTGKEACIRITAAGLTKLANLDS